MLEKLPRPDRQPFCSRLGWHQRMVQELLATGEAERKRMAHLLHDRVLQDLGVCILNTELCDHWLATGQIDRAQAEARALRESLDRVVEQLRAVLDTVRPLQGDSEGTGGLLAEYCRSLQAARQPPVKMDGPVPNVADWPMQVFLVRMLQAALTAAAACPAVDEVRLSFQDSLMILQATVEYRCRPLSAIIDLDLSLLDTVRVMAEIAGGWSQVERKPNSLRILFAMPSTGETMPPSIACPSR